MRELDEFRKSVEEFRKRIEESFETLLRKYEENLEEIEEKSEEASKEELTELYLQAKRLRISLEQELRALYRKFRSTAYDLRRTLRTLTLKLPEGYDKVVDDLRKTIIDSRDHLRYYRDSAQDLVKSIRELELHLRTSAGKPVEALSSVGIGIFKLSNLDRVMRGLEDVLEEVLSSTRRIVSKTSEVISSVRIPEPDARLIRSLVDAGIFKSRNDALAYFVHKGVEASRDWLERVQERLKKIRELQEKTRKELEEIFRETQESEEERET